MQELENKIGYKFKDISLLEEALTHSSYANEHKSKHIKYNERLEFLGDAVLSIVVSDYIFKNCPELPEGELTKLRASLVCEKSLFVFAKQLGLGKYLILSKGERHNGGAERRQYFRMHLRRLLRLFTLTAESSLPLNIFLTL